MCSIFAILLQIVDINEQDLQWLPTKIQVDSVKNYALLEELSRIALLIHLSCFFLEDILFMEHNKFKLHLRRILHDMIWNELLIQVSIFLHIGMYFSVPWNSNMETLKIFQMNSIVMGFNQMDRFCSSLE